LSELEPLLGGPHALGTLRAVAIALVLGAVLGFERESAAKPAGLRTHMLVAAAAALIVGLGETMIGRFSTQGAEGAPRLDPIRLLEAVVTGVSFLGAGTILREPRGARVHGLTTAASLLLTAAIGASVALEQLGVALGVTLLALVTLRGVGWLEERWRRTATDPP
jgi:putative Mg2+ transporter-C (MgtC) family protein